MSETDSRRDALETVVSRQLKIEVPLICGAMYPCSNPELVAAVSEAGGIGIIQPLVAGLCAWTRVQRGAGDDPAPYRQAGWYERGRRALFEGLYGAHAEATSISALEEGIRFFVTSLGNPRWVVDRVHQVGGLVYHDVTERKWAEEGVGGRCRRPDRCQQSGPVATLVPRDLRTNSWMSSATWRSQWFAPVGVGDEGRVRERLTERAIRRSANGNPIHRHAGVSVRVMTTRCAIVKAKAEGHCPH